MQELKFIASCLLDFLVAVYVTLFCKVELPELDPDTEAFYHK
jgi:hypothetical protein